MPNGRMVDDPHYHYKLRWLAALRDTAADWLAADPHAQIALCGDYNIAPTDDDVWSVEFFRHSTHVTPPERAAFQAIVDVGYTDVVRPHTAGRVHLLGLHPAAVRQAAGHADRLRPLLTDSRRPGHRRAIDRQERKGKGASDHAPVIVELG